ncbi:MAG: TetR/AcrR family transcriptional regulator [Gemmatimonadota bacterium]
MPRARSQVKSRRELYSEATRSALLKAATELFATRGFLKTSLEDVAGAAHVTRGAVYHHFAGKQALFEAVLDAQERRADTEILATATSEDPWEAATQALSAFLDKSCDPVYGRLMWLEGPTAMGWHRWREFEQQHAFGLVTGFVEALMDAGYLERQAVDSTVKFAFWMLGGAGLAVAEAPDVDKAQVRDEWAELLRRAMSGLRKEP